MIFVTVGNDHRAFDRLLKKIDEIALRIPGKIVVQKGYSGYCPRNVECFDFIPMRQAMDYIKGAELVVSHAGIGTIILCREHGVPLLIFPRRRQFGEHMNDHQMEVARALEERGDGQVTVVHDEEQLEKGILEALENRGRCVPGKNPGRANLIRTIREFIEGA
jgi:UDP-N-acetylglucosamine transferase subunit ALG13